MQKKKQRDSMIDESKDFHVIPSPLKRQSKWVLIAGETLKAMQHIMVTATLRYLLFDISLTTLYFRLLMIK